MPDQSETESANALSTDTKITTVFVVLGVVSWIGATELTDSRLLQFGLLLGVGVVVPRLINDWRAYTGRRKP